MGHKWLIGLFVGALSVMVGAVLLTSGAAPAVPVAATPLSNLADRPRGIFVLAGLGGPHGGTDQSLQIISQIGNLDYIAGVTIGFSWAATEAAPGQYDFSKIDAVMAALQPTGKKLNVEVFAVEVPEYLVEQLPAEEVWESHAPGGRTVTTAVPWSQTALNAWRTYLQALADHPVPLPDGTLVRFADHPTLLMLDAPIVGLQCVRDLTQTLTTLPEYTRTKFVNAVVQSVHMTRDVFPHKFGFLGFFRMDDADHSYPLDQEIMDRLLQDFNNPGQLTLGFFQETLNEATPLADGLGKHLFAVKDRTYIVFQALKPFTGVGGKATLAIQFAYETYNAAYVEIYVADVLDPAQTQDLQKWNAILTGFPFRTYLPLIERGE